MSTETLAAPMLWDDSPRTRRNDPPTSHAAADKSQKTVKSVRDRVTDILTDLGPLAAFEVCEIYARRAHALGWSRVTHESPRKRLSDMKRDGVVVDTEKTRVNREGSPEVVVALKGELA